MGLQHAIRTLVLTSRTYIAGLEFDEAGQAEVNAGLARWGDGPINGVDAQPVPACGHLEAALDAIEGAEPVAAAIRGAQPYLQWVTYDGYPHEAIGWRFPKAHAFTTIIGTTGFVHADDFALGLFLIAPRTLYRDHRHAAPELYAPLTGPTDWRFGPETPWETRGAHLPVWNPSMAVHATRVRDVPLLCYYCWTRKVDKIASVAPASDWDEIEAAL